jgi:hypothetical protein
MNIVVKHSIYSFNFIFIEMTLMLMISDNNDDCEHTIASNKFDLSLKEILNAERSFDLIYQRGTPP